MCFRLIQRHSTNIYLNFDIIIVGMSGLNRLKVVLARLAIPKSSNKTSREFKPNIWNIIQEEEREIEISSVQIGRIESREFG